MENPLENNDFIQTVEKLVIINHIEKIKLGEIQAHKKIGEGGQAKVYHGTFEGKQVAVKVMHNVDYKCFAHELVIIAYLEHPNIPKFYGIITEQNVLSLVFEFIDGKTLDEFKANMNENNLNYIKNDILMDKLVDFLTKNNIKSKRGTS